MADSSPMARMPVATKKPIPAAPSYDAVRKIFRTVVSKGRLAWGRNFIRRMALFQEGPGFNLVDVVSVLRRGKIVLGPQYNENLHAWRYEVEHLIEGRKFLLSVWLDCGSDFQECPRVEIQTGCFRKGQRKDISKKVRGRGKQDDESGDGA